MLVRQSGRCGLVILVAALAACDGAAGPPVLRQDASIDAAVVAAPDAARPDGPAAATDGSPIGVDHPPPVFEAADPKLTQLLLPWPAALVGWGESTCTNALPAKGDTWCAFSRPKAGATTTELWVFNLTQAIAAGPPRCDGTSPGCLRLTSDLWVGRPAEGPAHPITHRFDGETLIFHAAAGTGPPDVYEGPVWAWRPGWRQARKLTTDKGLRCKGDRSTPTVFCLDAATFERSNDSFSKLRLRSFDLRAGKLGDLEATPPLPLVERIVATGNEELQWQAAFAPGGDAFLYSFVPAGAPRPVLKMVKTANVGAAPAALVDEDVTAWRISHDGARVYHLRGVDRTKGLGASGALASVDLPAGAGSRTLREKVVEFDLLGANDESIGDPDRGVVIAADEGGPRPAIYVMKDPAHPTQVVGLPAGVTGVQVSSDARYTLYFEDVGTAYPNAKVWSNDGAGHCTLNLDRDSETYGGHFSSTGRTVFWIEFNGDSEEGRYASPGTCGDVRKFGDYVTWYSAVDEDFVVFMGTDEDDSASHLEYAQVTADAKGPRKLPKVIDRDVDESVVIVGKKDSVRLLYSLSRQDAAQRGVFMHGPLPLD